MAKSKPSIFLVVCLLAVCSISLFPSVEAAQTTTIYQISSPTSTIAGSENPLPVVVTVYYNNTVTGYRLVVGILYAELSPARVVPGVVTSSTDPCINEVASAALCAITVPKPSGVERIIFQVGGIFGGSQTPGSWGLNATSILEDSHNNLIPGSVSSRLFKIDLTPVSLIVDVPTNVAVSVDGVPQPPGSISLGVGLGKHNITVPQLVNVTQSTRLMFDQWSDGSSSTLRTIIVTKPTTLQADYVTQNLLTLNGVQSTATISTWYNSDSNATFSTDRYEPMPGVLGAVGLRLSFQGWYENGQLLTDSATGTISMNTPHTLTALWRVDYSIPASITLVIIAVAIITFFLLRRRIRTPATRKRSKRRRKRS